jgi:hypothetical protein
MSYRIKVNGQDPERFSAAEGRSTIWLRLLMTVEPSLATVHYGSLGSNTGMNIYSLIPNNVAVKSVANMSWFRLTQDEKQKDFELALSLATSHPELFEVGHEYDFADFQKAILHVSSPDKTGIVLLRSPV